MVDMQFFCDVYKFPRLPFFLLMHRNLFARGLAFLHKRLHGWFGYVQVFYEPFFVDFSAFLSVILLILCVVFCYFILFNCYFLTFMGFKWFLTIDSAIFFTFYLIFGENIACNFKVYHFFSSQISTILNRTLTFLTFIWNFRQISSILRLFVHWSKNVIFIIFSKSFRPYQVSVHTTTFLP